jgi:RNA polymerase sigma-70 factor (ECF subfamily)
MNENLPLAEPDDPPRAVPRLNAARQRDTIGAFMESPPVQDSPYSEMTAALIAVRDRRDRDAFARLFDHFAPRLKAMLIRGGLRDGSAEDVVQDVMLTVWHKAAQFDPHRAEAQSWIYRIARNRQIDLARRRPLPLPEPIEEPEGAEPDAAQILALQQEVGRLRAALARLSPEQGRALRQAYIDELPHSQISQATGLPLGTIKSRIRLGLERLRHELRDLKP